MAKKKKKSAPPKPRPNRDPESKTSTAASVMWMLCILFGTVSETAFLIIWALLRGGVVQSESLRVLGVLMLLTSLIVGLLCLALSAAAYRVRTSAPPYLIFVWSLCVGLIPLLLLAIAWAFPPLKT